MRIKIQRLRPDAVLPRYAHGPDEDAGMDLCAVEPALLAPGVPQLVPTGLRIEVPHAITLPNSPATIDPGYRGEIRVILLNLGRESYQVHAGDRVAQMVIARYERIEWDEADLADSRRGEGGFGSSGR